MHIHDSYTILIQNRVQEMLRCLPWVSTGVSSMMGSYWDSSTSCSGASVSGHLKFGAGSPRNDHKFADDDSGDGFGWGFGSSRFIGVSQGDSK